MTKPILKVTRAHEVVSSDELIHAGDICIRHVPVYNSSKIIYAVVLKCPYCGMDMMSTNIHRIRITRLHRFLSRLGLPFGITVKPKLGCPYNPEHLFSITNGKIKPE